MTAPKVRVALDALDAHASAIERLHSGFLEAKKSLRDLELGAGDFGNLSSSKRAADRWNDGVEARRTDADAASELLRFIQNCLIEVQRMYDGTDVENKLAIERNIPIGP